MTKPERGDIYYIERSPSCREVGSEQYSGRPAVIVSAEAFNRAGEVYEVVYLTTQPKRDMPTHITVRGTGKPSTALCEQITTVSAERLGDWCGRASAAEMQQIDAAMAISLQLDAASVPEEEDSDEITEVDELRAEVAELTKDLVFYRRAYYELIDKLLVGGDEG